jgi:4-amino-4-deoxy-L-arabinose transferase-like glycosyltransferase
MKRRTKRAQGSAVVNPTLAAPGYWARSEEFIKRYAVWLTIAFVLLATGRIIATYNTFSYVFDEPAHIACGMEWLERHTYTYETQHPPLTRVMAALLPRLSGAHGWKQASEWDEGLAILSGQGHMDRTLALARMGTLGFFWLLCWVTYACARWIYGTSAAVLSVFLLTMTPTILAHAGLATTDMGLTATLLLAIYTGWRWLEEPTPLRSVIFGASLGLALLSKLSTLPFFPAVAVMALAIWWISERPALSAFGALVRVRGLPALMAALVAGAVIWAGYRFSFGHTSLFSFPVPAPELFSGIQEVRKHNATGHLTYLLGASNTVGWPYFYVVALGVKTPLAILGLGAFGLILLSFRKWFGTRGWILSSTVLGILIVASFFSQIKIGTRHVLPVFAALAMAGGCATVWLLRRTESHRVAQLAVVVLLAWVPGTSLRAHPDYLAYFNAVAGSKPEDFLVDSDLDWSQDVKRLAQRLKQVGATEVSFNQYAPGDLPKLFGFPPIHPLDVNGPRPGWNAISITPMKYGLFGGDRYIYDRGFHFWPEQVQPIERIGSGILLYYSDGRSGR